MEHLYFSDEQVYGPEGNPQPSGSPEEILAQGQKMYCELSEETKEFFDFMMENQLWMFLEEIEGSWWLYDLSARLSCPVCVCKL